MVEGGLIPMNGKPDQRGLALPFLRSWRNYRALTQAELAKLSGVSRATISSAEGGARIWPSHARELAAALEVTPADLQKHTPGIDRVNEST